MMDEKGIDDMYKGLIISNDQKIKDECRLIVNTVGEIEPTYLDSVYKLDSHYTFFNFLFIIVSEIDQNVIEKIADAQIHAPGLSTIFYNHSLNYVELPEIARSSKIKMIIGENRKVNLSDLIKQLKNSFWRKIPYKQLGIKFEELSPRMKKALQFIETASISDCNINSIASYLNISAGYFSQEFKRETRKSFRSFMQKVIDYYENVIFSKVNLPAKNISQILGYSELSSFSRSFKKRKGISPTKYKKLVQL